MRLLWGIQLSSVAATQLQYEIMIYMIVPNNMFVYSNNHPTNYTPPQIPNSKSCTVPSSKKTVIYFPCFKRCALSFLQHFFFFGGRFFQKCAVHQSPLQPPSQDIPRSLFLVNRSLALVMFLKPRPLDGHGLNPWKRPGYFGGPWGLGAL